MSWSMFQRAVVATIANIEEVEQARIGFDQPRRIARVSRRALELILCFDWRQFHTDKVAQLIKMGYVRQTVNTSGIIYYELGIVALRDARTRQAIARSHCYAIDESLANGIQKELL